MTKPPFHIGIAVWGEPYITNLAELTAGTLLAPGNIPSVSEQCDVLIHIVTNESSKIALKEHPNIKLLSIYATIIFTLLTDIESFGHKYDMRYQLASLCHVKMLDFARDAGAPFVLICPDQIFADGAIGNLVKFINSGKTLIMCGSVRVNASGFDPLVRRLAKGGIISISAMDLVRASLDHIHPFSKASFWDDHGSTSISSSVLLWNVPGQGFVGRFFHLHPILIMPVRENHLMGDSIDGDYVADWPIKDIHVITDSEDYFSVDLTRDDKMHDLIGDRSNTIVDVAIWARHHANQAHINNFLHTLLFRTGDVNGLPWIISLVRAETVAREILRILEYI